MATFVYNQRTAPSSISRQIYRGSSNVEFKDGIIRINNEGTDFYAPLGQSLNWYDGEILTKFRYSGSDGLIGVVGFRFTGYSQDTANGYSISLLKDRDTPGFVVYDNKTGAIRGSEYPFNHQQNTWYWVRVNWKGQDIKYKVWRDGVLEPSTWSREITSSKTSGAIGQTAGLYTFNRGVVEYGWLSYENYGETVMGPAPVHVKDARTYAYSVNPYGAYHSGGYVWPTNSVQLKGNRAFEHLTILKPKLTYTPPRYELRPNRVTERLMITSPALLGNGPKYNFRGNRGWVHLVFKTKPTLTYIPPKPGELRPAQVVERLTIRPPALTHTGPVYALRASRITERVNISSPTLTVLTAAYMQPEGVSLRVDISSPSVIFVPKPEVLTLKPVPTALRLTITRTNNLLDPSVYNIEYKQYKPDYVGIKAYEGETLNIDRYRPDTIETGKIDSIELNTNRYKQIVIK